MKKVLIAILLISITFINCSKNRNKGFVINGEISGYLPNYIYINYGKYRDSASVINRKFHFVGKVESPILANFTIPPVSSIEHPFYIENSNINVNISVKKKPYKNIEVNFIKVDSLVGSNAYLLQVSLKKFINKNSSKTNWNNKLYDKLEKIIEDSPTQRYSADFLSDIINDSVLDISQLKRLYKKIDKNNPSYISMEKIRRRIYPYKVMNIGNKIINFSLPNQDSIMISTNKFKGEIVLIDFWASWCVPCRKQNVELKKIFTIYKSKGFKVLGVSVDTNRDKWLSAINKDGLDWDNVNENNGFDSKLAGQYNLMNSIPHNYLIDREGKIIAIDIEMQGLKTILDELLIN